MYMYVQTTTCSTVKGNYLHTCGRLLEVFVGLGWLLSFIIPLFVKDVGVAVQTLRVAVDVHVQV